MKILLQVEIKIATVCDSITENMRIPLIPKETIKKAKNV